MRQKKERLNFIDLFSGAGGLSCGFMMAGFHCVLGVDADKYAIESFKANHQGASAYCGDIRKLTQKEITNLIGDQPVHAVVGGPPCQGFSTVGIGNPQDRRNHLFLEFVRIVKITKPQFVVVENVTGLLAKKNEDTLRAIFLEFSKLGYNLSVKVLCAESFGVPEHRRRTIIIGSKINETPYFPSITHGNNLQEKILPLVTVGEALNDLKTKKGEIHNHDIEGATVKSVIDRKRVHHIPEGKGIRYQKDEEAYLPKNLRLDVDWNLLPENRFRQTRYQRLDRKKVSPTIMTHRHGYFHPTEDRYLTPREAAKIQSFPNDFIFKGPLSAQWRQIGNAVPPLLGKAIAKSLLLMYQDYQKNSVIKKKKKSEVSFSEIRGRAFLYDREYKLTTT